MKTKTFVKNLKRQKSLWPLAFLAVLAAISVASVTHRKHDLVIHEWGTFTSVQGGDGVLMPWQPLQTTVLPTFVYDWKNPGLNRQCTSPFGSAFIKSAL